MRLITLTIAPLVLVACGGSGESNDRPGSQLVTSAVEGLSAPTGVVDHGEFSRDHVDGIVDYEQTPPVGGPHQPVWQTCDFYDTPIPNERAVHSMEHGAVWITYSPDLAADQLAVIEDYADGEREVLASPFDDLPSPVVASAWGLQLEFESANDPALLQFVSFYENGPQTPEPDTPCAGGAS
jgi:hypothetical protein